MVGARASNEALPVPWTCPLPHLWGWLAVHLTCGAAATTGRWPTLPTLSVMAWAPVLGAAGLRQGGKCPWSEGAEEPHPKVGTGSRLFAAELLFSFLS